MGSSACTKPWPHRAHPLLLHGQPGTLDPPLAPLVPPLPPHAPSWAAINHQASTVALLYTIALLYTCATLVLVVLHFRALSCPHLKPLLCHTGIRALLYSCAVPFLYCCIATLVCVTLVFLRHSCIPSLLYSCKLVFLHSCIHVPPCILPIVDST